MRRTNRFVITLIIIGALLCPAVSAPARDPAPRPDLVVDKISLNASGNIVVVIRNAGPGTLPDKTWAMEAGQAAGACFVIMIGVEFVDYVTLLAVDPNRTLKNPGGSITYTSTIRIQEPTAVRVWLDPTEQIEEASEANNINAAILKPQPVVK